MALTQHLLKTKKSCYLFKKFPAGDKSRGARPCLFVANQNAPHLISQYWYNPTRDTRTQYCIAWDLDSDRCHRKWRDKHGAIKWGKICDQLIKDHPFLAYRFNVTKSTGGKGLALWIAISPLELTLETERQQKFARSLQQMISDLFNSYEMGSDEAAMGLGRDFPNWMNKDRRVAGFFEGDIKLMSKARPSVLNELAQYLNKIKIPKPKKLANDIRTERKLVTLYDHFLEQWGRGSSEFFATKELENLTKIDNKTLRKILSNPPSWLKAKKIKSGYWELTFKPTTEFSRRAIRVRTQKIEGKNSVDWNLCAPEDVEDGDINRWVWNLAVILKQSGVEEKKALEMSKVHIDRVGGRNDSWSCLNFKRILRSIYKNRPETFNIHPGKLCEFLLDQELARKTIKNGKSIQKPGAFAKALEEEKIFCPGADSALEAPEDSSKSEVGEGREKVAQLQNRLISKAILDTTLDLKTKADLLDQWQGAKPEDKEELRKRIIAVARKFQKPKERKQATKKPTRVGLGPGFDRALESLVSKIEEGGLKKKDRYVSPKLE